MTFEQYCVLPKVVELESGDKVGAFRELAVAVSKALDIRKSRFIAEEMLKREEAASTFIGQGLAMPQARGPIKVEFAVAVGRSLKGVEYNAARGALAHVIVLLVSREDGDNMRQVSLLAEIAGFFKSDAVRDLILSTEEPPDIRTIIKELKKFAPGADVPAGTRRRTGLPIIRTALTLAREIKASVIMVFADAVRDNDFLDQMKSRERLVVVTSSRTRFEMTTKYRRFKGFLQTPAIPASRTAQIKIGILLALSRGIITREDLAVCISGTPGSGVFDTIVAINVEKEYDFFFATAHDVVPPDVKPEVLERVVGLAGEIAVEGREGKPVGTIFVLGDTNSVNMHVRQLIINPFRGYSEAERNILDPSLAETIKEFAAIDGAFVVTGDGVVLSAGSYLRPAPVEDQPPIQGGLGARHFAAAGITACTNALAIAISESTGMVTLFKNGISMMTLAQPVSHGQNKVNRFLQ